jgi:hypothetical protein
MATTISIVIVRLDRTIQYAEADVFHLGCLRMLDTRFRGYDESCGDDEEENDRKLT